MKRHIFSVVVLYLHSRGWSIQSISDATGSSYMRVRYYLAP